MIKLIITGDPIIKKNSRPIYNGKGGRPFIGKSQRLKNAEIQAMAELLSQKRTKGIKTITEPVIMKAHFYNATKRKKDLSNLYEFVQDCLQECEIIENDHLIIGHDGSRQHYDKENPRTEILLLIEKI